MNYFGLTGTTKEVLEKIEASEKEGILSEHLDPIDYNCCDVVDGSYEYIPKGKEALKQGLSRFFIVNPFIFIVNHFIFKTKVYGRKNIKGVKSAIVTCNHVNKLDALTVMKAAKGHKLRIVVGDFNNRNDRLGDFMRAAGTIPFGTNTAALKNFNKAVHKFLEENKYILFFPERSEWWCYEKPRPLMNGAFHYAAKEGVPVIPTFITFEKSGKFYKNGIEKRYFRIHVMEPIYPDKELNPRENVEMMREKNAKMWKDKYEEVYGRKLTFTYEED